MFDHINEMMVGNAALRQEVETLKAQLSAYYGLVLALQDKLAAERDQALKELQRLKAEQAEHGEHWYNSETGWVECECCCKGALDLEAMRKERDQARREALEEAAKYFERHNCVSGWYRSNIVANIRALAAKEKA